MRQNSKSEGHGLEYQKFPSVFLNFHRKIVSLYLTTERLRIWPQIPGGGWLRKTTSEFLRCDFLLVFSSKYRPSMHRFTTIHERDQPMNNTTTWTRPIAMHIA